MLTDYIQRQLARAKYKIVEDGSYFGEIPALRGVWASNATLEQCRAELQEVLEDWLVLKLRDRESVPGFKLAKR